MGVGMPAPPSALEIARALIRFPSVTPTDAGALPYLRDLLGEAGFAAELVTFEAPGTPAVLNLYARFGARSPNLAFAGHTDVVPPGDKALWRFDPFSGEIADGELWGRGACDMKGGVAAAVAAALRFIAKPPFEGSISFLITGDEEGPAINGTVKLVDWALAKGETFDHCILGELTSVETVADTIKHGRRGSLNGRLTIRGRQGHAAYPHIADNPIPSLAPILTTLLSPPFDQGNADFEPTNLEVVSVDVGNPAFNVIPGEVRLKFNVRFNDLWTNDSARRRDQAPGGGGGRRRTRNAHLRAQQRKRLSYQARAVHRSRRPSGRGRDRAKTFALDRRGDFGRALHQERLSGGRAWPRQRNDPRRQRARRGRRSRSAVAHL